MIRDIGILTMDEMAKNTTGNYMVVDGMNVRHYTIDGDFIESTPLIRFTSDIRKLCIERCLDLIDNVSKEHEWGFFIHEPPDEKCIEPIIRNTLCHCPIESLFAKKFDHMSIRNVFDKGRSIGISDHTITMMVATSDGCITHSHYVKEVRDKLEDLIANKDDLGYIGTDIITGFDYLISKN